MLCDAAEIMLRRFFWPHYIEMQVTVGLSVPPEGKHLLGRVAWIRTRMEKVWKVTGRCHSIYPKTELNELANGRCAFKFT
jgi:hypothetical protein